TDLNPKTEYRSDTFCSKKINTAEGIKKGKRSFPCEKYSFPLKPRCLTEDNSTAGFFVVPIT
ncbi:MAG: hypothetical protein J1G30_07020, partial [Spirochaetales bacterium]|nr:hypothetical protein [Spirochaetales bacterium]